DSCQFRDALDMIDVVVERAFFFFRAHQDGIDADHSMPFTNHLDLFIADIALDVVISAKVRMRHDRRLCCDRENLFEPNWIDVREIDNYSKCLAFMQTLAAKSGEPLPR